MGGSNSTEESPSSSEKETPMVMGSPIEEAQGGGVDFDKALNAVAAQVYDNVHTQLEDLQTEKLKKTASMAADIKSKLQPAAQSSGGKAVCEAEVGAVVACLEGGNSLLKCDAVIENLKRCSAAAATA